MAALKVATFNLYNLARAGTPLYEKPGRTSGETEDKRKWVADVLAALDADVIAFQEVFHQSELKKVFAMEDRRRRRRHSGPTRILAMDEEKESTETPNVALATSFDVEHFAFHAEIPQSGQVAMDDGGPVSTTFSRPVLHAAIHLPTQAGTTLAHFFVVHLKSKRGEMLDGEEWADPKTRARARSRALTIRAAEAAGLRALFLEVATDGPAIVLGDFNDDEQSVTTHIITDDPEWKGAHSPGEPDPHALFSARELAPRPPRAPPLFTHLHRGRWEALDHILVTSHFCGGPQSLAEISGARTISDHLTAQGPIGRLTSDHAAFMALFDWRG